MWNTFPLPVRQATTIASFKKGVKEFQLEMCEGFFCLFWFIIVIIIIIIILLIVHISICISTFLIVCVI